MKTNPLARPSEKKLKQFNRLKLIGILLIFALWHTHRIQAQSVNTYNFTGSTRTYVPLTGGTTIPALRTDDAVSGAIPLPFTFNFAGTNISQVYASSNGFLAFPNIGATPINNLSGASSSSFNIIAPFWDDLEGGAMAGSVASYKTTGAIGSRIFTFEWFKWQWVSTNAAISFQVLLYEGTDKIEFSYRQEPNTSFYGNTVNYMASIGIAAPSLSGPDYLALDGAGPNPSANSNVNTVDISTRPATNQLYTFSKSTLKDISAIGLAEPIPGYCGLTQPVRITIRNTGAVDLNFNTSPVTISGTISRPSGPSVSIFETVNTGTLTVNSNLDVLVNTTPAFNMNSPGNYTFSASASIPGDGRSANNDMTQVTRIVAASNSLPPLMAFTGYNGNTLSGGWKESQGSWPSGNLSGWDRSAGLGTAVNVTAKINLSSNTMNEWILGSKISPVAGDVIRLETAITGNNNLNTHITGMAGTDDQVQVMVSTDCGNTFMPIFTYDATNTSGLTNVLTDRIISLAPYAGQHIILGIFATDGTVDDAADYDFHIDNIFVGTPPAIDLGVLALANPVSAGCYNSAESIKVTIKNFGSADLDFNNLPATIQVNVSGAASYSLPAEPLTGVLLAGASRDVMLSNTLNMSATGVYTFSASINPPTGDNNSANNSLSTTRTVFQIYSLPQHLDFTNYNGNNLSSVYQGWSEFKPGNGGGLADWSDVTGLGSPTNKTIVASFNGTDGNDYIISPKLVPAATSELRFKKAITESGSLTPDPTGMAGTDDKLDIMVSLDCGTNFTPIYTLNAATTTGLSNILTEQVISLSAYAAQPIIIAFRATDGPIADLNSYFFHLDDISIVTPAIADIGVTALLNPSDERCYSQNETVTVTVKNLGSSPVTFTSNDPATVSVSIRGAVSSNFNALISNGTLNPGDSQNVSVGAINMANAGAYTFKAFTSFAGDNTSFNDTITTSRSVDPNYQLPFSIDFNGFTGANLSATHPGWREASGPTPLTNSTSSWMHSNAAQTTAFGSTTARVSFSNSSSVFRSEWMVGPKFTATAATHLLFKAAVTSSVNAGSAMMNTNDTLFIMVSTDCGASFQKFSSLQSTSNLTNTLSTIDINLSALAGQQVIIAFYALHGTPKQNLSYDIHIDDVTIRNMFATDLKPVLLKTAFSGCGLSAAENVCVVVKNEGTAPQSNIPVAFRVNTQNGPGTLQNEFIPGPIAPGDTMRYCFNAKANLAANGKYTLQVLTKSLTDGVLANDTISRFIASDNPLSITANNAGRCGPGVVNLTANISNNTSLEWYTAATGGLPVNIGNSYSPNINTSTTFYVATGTATEITGKAMASGLSANINSGSLIFNAAKPFRLRTVEVYTDNPTGGNITINLYAPAGTSPIQTKTFMLPPVSFKTAVTVPLDFLIPAAGNGYRLEKASSGPTLHRDPALASGSHFPIISQSEIVTITNGSATGIYYFFYNWVISSGCTSTRTPVTASINSAPTVNLGADKALCGSASVLLDAGNAGAAYEWLVNNTTITGATSQTYTATTPGTYIAKVTLGGCTSSDTVIVNSSAAIAKPIVTASGATVFCQGGSVTLTGVSTTSGITYSWLLNNAPITGGTATAYTANTSGNYRVIASLGAGCSDTSAVMVVTVNPTPATPVITQTGNVLTSSATTGNQWYLNGSPISGATGNTFIPISNGNYTVVVTVNNCPSAVSNVIGFVTGISKNLDGTSVSVYPNPNSGTFIVKLTGYGKDANVSLYSLTGQEIKTIKVKANAGASVTGVNAGNLPTGIYLIKVISENRVNVLRVMVE